MPFRAAVLITRCVSDVGPRATDRFVFRVCKTFSVPTSFVLVESQIPPHISSHRFLSGASFVAGFLPTTRQHLSTATHHSAVWVIHRSPGSIGRINPLLRQINFYPGSPAILIMKTLPGQIPLNKSSPLSYNSMEDLYMTWRSGKWHTHFKNATLT